MAAEWLLILGLQIIFFERYFLDDKHMLSGQNSISIAEVLISLESLFVLAKTIIWALLTQVWIVLMAQFRVIKEEKTMIAVVPMELDIDLSIVTNKVLVNSTNM